MIRRKVVQEIINILKCKTYLEIGVFGGYTFLNLKGVNLRIGVDTNYQSRFFPEKPISTETEKYYEMTSDSFFRKFKSLKLPKPEVILVDGDHSYQQSAKDIKNALVILADGGVIVVHDTLNIARNCGVWRAFLECRAKVKYSDSFSVISAYGVGVLVKGNSSDGPNKVRFSKKEIAGITFETYIANKSKWQNAQDFSHLKTLLAKNKCHTK